MDLESNDELLFLEMDETYENDVKKIKDDEYVLSGDYNDYVPAILKRTQAIWESEYDHRDKISIIILELWMELKIMILVKQNVWWSFNK